MQLLVHSFFFLLLIFSSASAEYTKEFAESEYSVAVAFLVADFKYNDAQGVKLCEVKQASTSLFTMGRFMHDGECVTSKKFVEIMGQWGVRGWNHKTTPCDGTLRNFLNNDPLWTSTSFINNILKDPDYKYALESPFYNPKDISQYAAFAYGKRNQVKQILQSPSTYQRVIVIDEPTFSYWIDKLKMAELFTLNSTLEKVRPIWKNCIKKDDPEELYQSILEEIPGDYVVIKPRTCFKSKGIMLVHKENLLEILTLIMTTPPELSKHQDKTLRYWAKDSMSSFLVEEFIESDPVQTESGRLFDTTYRTTFIAVYEKDAITLHLLDTYLKYPKLALDEPGKYADKHISNIHVKEVGTIPPERLIEIERQLSEPLLLMFENMLKYK